MKSTISVNDINYQQKQAVTLNKSMKEIDRSQILIDSDPPIKISDAVSQLPDKSKKFLEDILVLRK